MYVQNGVILDAILAYITFVQSINFTVTSLCLQGLPFYGPVYKTYHVCQYMYVGNTIMGYSRG